MLTKLKCTYIDTLSILLCLDQESFKLAYRIRRIIIVFQGVSVGHYYAGKLLQSTSKVDAFQAFEISARQGYKDGEIWLGTYYACNKDNLKARYWLDIAKKGYNDPDYIDDIYAEIDELGMPTNCIDGWVY